MFRNFFKLCFLYRDVALLTQLHCKPVVYNASGAYMRSTIFFNFNCVSLAGLDRDVTNCN